MSSLCLSVCPSVCLSVCPQSSNSTFLQHTMQKCSVHSSRMFQNARKMFQTECRMSQNVPECSRMHAECMQKVPECCILHSECYGTHAECSRMFQSRLTKESFLNTCWDGKLTWNESSMWIFWHEGLDHHCDSKTAAPFYCKQKRRKYVHSTIQLTKSITGMEFKKILQFYGWSPHILHH